MRLKDLFETQSPYENPQFKKWFGDSKAITNGKPWIVFHGTDTDFTKFDISKFGKTDFGWFGKGFYLTPSSEEASNYATGEKGIKGSVMPLYVKAENPFITEQQSMSQDYVDEIRGEGYDAIFRVDYRNDPIPQEIVVFEPNQIKSIFNFKFTDSEHLNERRLILDPERDMTVWENPSHTELKQLLDKFGSLRGASGPGEPLYVWDANTWVHHTIHKYLGYMPYYLYFSKVKKYSAEEWLKNMKRMGDIFVGVKYSIISDNNKEIPRPDIPLSYSPIKRALQL